MKRANLIFSFFSFFLKKRYWFFIVLFLLPVWIFFVSPFLLNIPDDFIYEADMISVDNFYDEKIGDFQGEKYSKTRFSYSVEQEGGSILTIKNVFHVQDDQGKVIFHAEPLYGINRFTGQHVEGF